MRCPWSILPTVWQYMYYVNMDQRYRRGCQPTSLYNAYSAPTQSSRPSPCSSPSSSGVEWDTESTCTSNTFTSGIKKTCSRLLPLADWTESIIVVLSSYRNRPSGPGLRVFSTQLTRISAKYFLLSVKDCHSSGRYASLHFEGL